MKTNEELRHDVMDEIKCDPELREMATEIGVAARDGIVTLSGAVDTFRKKLAAEKAAQRVRGVRVVASDVEVKIGSIGKRTDTEIAEAIGNALRWNNAVNEDEIEVKVDNGWVFLDGWADFEHEKRSAQELIEDLVGVRGLTNNIMMKQKVIDTKDIRHRITAAYHRHASLDASSITIETAGGKVALYGKVASLAEKKEAANIARSAPGVTSVENNIEVETRAYTRTTTPEDFT